MDLKPYLDAASARHSHLCPRQVLGVRAALVGAAYLGLDVPRKDKRLLVITESDGCFTDGLEVVTGATMGHRTLRLADYGKIAATFTDVKTETSVRIAAHPDLRQMAWAYVPEEKRRYFAQLYAYQIMPVEKLFLVQPVQLFPNAKEIISRVGVRVACTVCGEEVINERETYQDGKPVCQACAGKAYYASQALDFRLCQSTNPVSFTEAHQIDVQVEAGGK